MGRFLQGVINAEQNTRPESGALGIVWNRQKKHCKNTLMTNKN
jgi:hypothetical protein